MTTKKSCQIRVGIAILLATLALPILSGYGDTVTLKSGTKLEGIITLEAADFIKIELSRTGSIKETKLIKRTDISSITKTKPDALAFAKLKGNLPTPSLMTSSSYQSLIKTGPEAFLAAYPDSLHKDDVQKILEELQAEKAKVDRGAIKREEEWISADRRQNFKTLVKSQIRVYSMKQKAAQANFTSALRDFEVIESQFVGTPAYPEAIKVALSILPNYGNQLTRQLKDVEFLNKKREADINLLPPESKARTEAAYKKEQDTFVALAEQEKKTGIKWRSVNRRNKESIAPMIDTIRQELSRLNKIDTAKLEEEAQKLVKIDELINENKLKEAKELLLESGGKVTSSGRKRSSRSKTPKSSYKSDLSNKITARVQASEDAAKNAAANAKAKKVTATINQSTAKMTAKNEAEDAKVDAKADDPAQDGSAKDALAAAMAARKKVADSKKQEADAAEAAKVSSKPKSTKKKTKPKKRSSSASSDSGGGISFQAILIGFALVMGIVIFVLKKMGIGGGSGGDDGGGGDE